MRALFDFLFESDLPVGLQVFWKLLTFSGAGLLIYAATSSASLAARIGIIGLALAWILLGIFTKLGDG